MANLPKYRTVMLFGNINRMMPYGLSEEERQAILRTNSDDRNLLSIASATHIVYALNNMGYRVISGTVYNTDSIMLVLEKPIEHSSS